VTTESRIKGHILLSRLSYVREVAGEAGLERVMAQLSPEERAALGGLILTVGWYPLELNLRLDAAIAATLSEGDPSQVFLAMGKASAEKNLHEAHAPYVRAGDPHFLLSKSDRIYATYYKSGYRTYERLGDTAAVLRTFKAETISGTDCLTVVGWYLRAIELCGGVEVKVTETQCRAKGAPHCEYHCEWK
jgi:uncharacterized protein (TIGR02265 family)